MTKWKSGLVIVAALLLVGCEPQEASIRLDPGTTFQTISGWEATADVPENPSDPAWEPYRQRLLDGAAYEVGINRIRLEIRSGAENLSKAWLRFASGEIGYKQWRALRYPTLNDNYDPREIDWSGFDFDELDFHIENTVLPMRERVSKRGESLFVNLCYVAFTEQIRNGEYIHDDPAEYAEFILAAFLHMRRKYGFVPDAVEVILEPDNVPEWDGKMIGRAIVATAARLAEHGFVPGFIAPSVTDMANAAPYFDDIASVAGAVEHMTEFSYHRYRNRTDENLGAIVRRAERHGLRTSMLEWWFGRGTHQVLHKDLKDGRNSAWQGRVLDGLFEINSRGDDVRLSLRPDTRYNLQYFNAIRGGAVRIGASSSRPAHCDPLAFVNPDGGHVVVVLVDQASALTVEGLPAGSYHVSWAVSEGSARVEPPLQVTGADPLLVNMPGAGVMTIAAVAAAARDP